MSNLGVFKTLAADDCSIRPFEVYKSWQYTSSGSMTDDGIQRLVAIKADPTKFNGGIVNTTTQRNLDTGSLLENIYNEKAASVVWYSLNNTYYRSSNPYDSFGAWDAQMSPRHLYDTAFIVSIPQKKFGEAVKPGSFRLNVTTTNSGSINLIDDGRGNLIHTELSASIENQVLYLRLNDQTYTAGYGISPSGSFEIPVDCIHADYRVKAVNTRINPTTTRTWGNSLKLTGNSYIRIPNTNLWNFKQSDDYTVSFFVSNLTGNGTLLSKYQTGTSNYELNGKLITGDVNFRSGQYPFDIVYSGSLVSARISNGPEVTTLQATTTPLDRVHICFQKSGSLAQLFINGVLTTSGSVPQTGNFYNEADIFIGSRGLSDAGLVESGSRCYLDEFFIFNRALSLNEIQILANDLTCINTNRVGNIFYEHGIAVISDPRPYFASRFGYLFFNDVLRNSSTLEQQASYIQNMTLEFNSTVTIFEHEYLLRLREDEFNFTSNPTIRRDNNEASDLPKDFVFNDAFSPYITTVGLYNKAGQLLVVGKLATPIKKRDDVDLNIVVRFDV